MLTTMKFALKNQNENMAAFYLIKHLKILYQEQARNERFDVSKTIFQGTLLNSFLVGLQVLKSIGYLDNLDILNFPLERACD